MSHIFMKTDSVPMRRRLRTSLLVVLLALALTPVGSTQASGRPASKHRTTLAWSQVTQPGPGPFRGLTAVSGREAWVGGDNGELWRTTDRGASWQDVSPPESELLGFRRIDVLGHGRVVLLARGGIDDLEGEEPSRAARIFVSADNGETWRQTFVNTDAAAFYDCLDMFPDGRHGLALSDPVDGRFRILATSDGGRSWHVRPPAGMPAALDGEYGIASGRCLQTSGDSEVWFGSAGAAARVFHSVDGGRTWKATDSTLPAGDVDNATGVWGLRVTNQDDVLAVGGTFADLALPYASAYTRDGRSWHAGGLTGGARFSVAWVPRRPGTAVSGGFNGTDITRDGGRSWTTFSQLPYEAVDCAPDDTCWGTGEDGTVGRLVIH
jgi:photosystem II stability/assembly factor-like uncharacterized protein